MHNNVLKAVVSPARVDSFATSLPVLALLCIGATHPQAVAQPQMVRWEILATVIEIEDPLGLFPDVRLGDPVRGMLKYDLTLLPLYIPTYVHYFTNEIWIDVARMVIENPRDGTELEFQTDVEGDLADVAVFNDFTFKEFPFDGVFAMQSVIPPDGFLGESPAIIVSLEGPTSNFPQAPQLPTIDDRLPSQLNLDDWPIAALVFLDAYAEDPTATGIAAEIYSLTAITSPHVAGDYNYDGDVDTDDYNGWRRTFGESGDHFPHYADGNGNGVVDAADYVVWRNNLGADISADSIAAVPEPTGVLLMTMAAAGVLRRQRWSAL